MRVGIVARPLALSVQVVSATEVREGRLRSVIHEGLPVILAGELGSPSRRVNHHVLGVAATSNAPLRLPQGPGSWLVRGPGCKLCLQEWAQGVSECSVA